MRKVVLLMLVALITLFIYGSVVNAAEFNKTDFEDIKVRFFVGGDPGDTFASVVYKGAKDAQDMLGLQVDYVFSGWNVEKMTAQLRDAIAANPDGIAMMGHPGDDAVLPLVEEAYEKGISMMYQNVDVPEVRANFGGGYVGANLSEQGRALGKEALRRFAFEKGDRATVFGAWGQPGRYLREEGCALAFEDAGLIVDRIVSPPEAASAPELLIPKVTAQLLKQPDTKVMVFSGGQNLGAAPSYMEAADKKPGEVICIGFDLSSAVINAFDSGYVQLTADQQPYLQGFLPILSLAFTEAYGMSPISYNTGAGFVTEDNYKTVADLANKGIR